MLAAHSIHTHKLAHLRKKNIAIYTKIRTFPHIQSGKKVTCWIFKCFYVLQWNSIRNRAYRIFPFFIKSNNLMVTVTATSVVMYSSITWIELPELNEMITSGKCIHDINCFVSNVQWNLVHIVWVCVKYFTHAHIYTHLFRMLAQAHMLYDCID